MAEKRTRVLIIGAGSVGIMAAYAVHVGGSADVTVVMRSNFAQVEKNGIDIDSIDHGHGIKGWRPNGGMYLPFTRLDLLYVCIHG
jgi:ketopantoate reductase